MLESNLKLIRMKDKLEEITKTAVSNLEKKMRNPFSTVADAQEIFDNYKNDTFYIYKVKNEINFYTDGVSYKDLLNSWDNFKLNMDIIINCNLPKKIDL